MTKLQTFIRVTLKTILWIVAVFVLLFVIIAGIIQLPFVQNAIVGYATAFVSDKTHTRVEIENVGISFPNSLHLEGVFLEDLQKDTLLYAGEVSLNISVRDIFSNHINILHFNLEDAVVKVYNTPADSLFNYQFLINAFSSDTVTTAPSAPWTFYMDELSIENSHLLYVDVQNELYTSAVISQLQVDRTTVDIEKIQVEIDEISMKDNAISYQTEKNPVGKEEFDAGNLHFSQLNMELRDIFYNADKTEVTVKQFSAVDQHNFTISRFETVFKMDAHTITLAPLKANTTGSYLDGEIKLQFASLQSIADSLGQLKLKADIRQSGFSNADILYFSPTLGTIDFFKNKTHITTLTGTIDGQIDDLEGKNIIVKAGQNTVLTTDFHISGLPDVDKAHFDFPNLTVQSNKQDVQMMGGSSIPESIDLPEDIRMNVDFYGKINEFETSVGLFTSFGNALLTASMATGEKYNAKMQLATFDLGSLIKDKEYGSLSMNATTQGQGFDLNTLHAEINDLSMGLKEKVYLLDSITVDITQQKQESQLKFRSGLLDLNYSGNLSLPALADWGNQFIYQYFALTDVRPKVKNYAATAFRFDLQLYNHPMIAEFFLPELHEFVPGAISGSYDGSKDALKVDADIQKIVYGSNEIRNLVFALNSDASALNYRLSTPVISNEQMKFENILLEGKLADNQLTANISSVDDSQFRKLLLRSLITRENDHFKLSLDPKEFYLMNKRWDIAPDNYIAFGDKGFMIHQLNLHHANSQINIHSPNQKFNDDLLIDIQHFNLKEITEIIEKDSNMLKGQLDGNILLKRVNATYGIIADAAITHLVVQDIPLGDLMLKASNPATDKFDVTLSIQGEGNDLSANGYYIPNGGDNSINIEATLRSLSMKTIEAVSMGQISQASGNVSGNFLVQGNTDNPKITGTLTFRDAMMNPAFLNNRISLKNESIELKPDGIYFNAFTLRDMNQQEATINGSVKMKEFSDFRFNLEVNSKDFLLFNTTAKDNDMFYGRMIIDSDIRITGPMSLPVIQARMKMKAGSNFSFVVPEEQLTTYKGEDVIVFTDTTKKETEKKETPTMGFSGFDLSSIIEADKEATLKLFMDPASSDSLVVKGDAALSLTMDRSGKMSLTGTYNVNEGSYLVSLESIIKKKFGIVSGSTIVWNGDPMDAGININAAYMVRTAPYNLVAEQMAGLTNAEQAGYKQQYPFVVLLKMRGEMMQPEISFEIQLLPEDKGILSGAMQQKLNLLNEDPSALNKQVFALLVLGRFVQENPLQSESAGTSALVRSTVSSFLTEQLNRLGSGFVPGVELNFDIQSYEDYQSGDAEGRTQVEVGLKKELFDDRLTVEIGGSVDVEGEKAKQNSASNITGDVTVEYKLTEDGRYRLKGFRHNQYEGVIEGQLVETGIGVVYVRDFDKWRELVKKPE